MGSTGVPSPTRYIDIDIDKALTRAFAFQFSFGVVTYVVVAVGAEGAALPHDELPESASHARPSR